MSIKGETTVENRTAEPVWVTPLLPATTPGWKTPVLYERADRRTIHEVNLSPRVTLPSFRSGDFRVGPGETLALNYLSEQGSCPAEFLVVDAQGRSYQLGPDPGEKRRFTLTSLARLTPASPPVARSREAGVWNWCFWGFVAALWLLPWALLVVWRWLALPNVAGPQIPPGYSGTFDARPGMRGLRP